MADFDRVFKPPIRTIRLGGISRAYEDYCQRMVWRCVEILPPFPLTEEIRNAEWQLGEEFKNATRGQIQVTLAAATIIRLEGYEAWIRKRNDTFIWDGTENSCPLGEQDAPELGFAGRIVRFFQHVF